MPWISKVGSAQTRSRIEYSLSPVSACAGHFIPQVGRLVERELLPGLELVLGRGLDGLVELGDLDLAIGVLELREDPDERLERVRRDSAIGAGVQVALERPDRDLGVAEAPERGVHGGPAGRIVRRVAHQCGVGAGALRLRAQQVGDDLPAALLLALEDEVDVERRAPLRVERRLICLEEAEDLALVVGGAARVEGAAPHGGLERRRDPFLQRIGRLDVVMAVDQQGGPDRARADSPPRPPDGPAPRECPPWDSRGSGAPRAAIRRRGGSPPRARAGRSHSGWRGTRRARPAYGSARGRRSWYPWKTVPDEGGAP